MWPRKLGYIQLVTSVFISRRGGLFSPYSGIFPSNMFLFCSFEPTTGSSPNSARPINRSRTGWNRSRAASEEDRACCRHRRDITRRRRLRRRRHHRRTSTSTTVRMQCRCWGSWSSCRRPTRTTARWPPRRRGTRRSSAAGTAVAGGAGGDDG